MAARKQSMVPSEGRRKSIYERKPSVDRRKSISLEGGPSEGGRRMSIIDLHRRFSTAESLAGRSGMSADNRNRTNVRYENTYKLTPDESFPISKAKAIANDVLNNNLQGKEYNKEECTRLSKIISDQIKQQTKALGFSRFKILSIVAIGQNQSTSRPSMSFTSRCIWNDKTDNFAEVTFKNRSLYAVALVYACYVD